MTVVRIDEMRLRLPGLLPQQAHELGQQVARQLAMHVEGLPASRQLGIVDLRLRLPAGLSPDQMVDEIVRAILERVGSR